MEATTIVLIITSVTGLLSTLLLPLALSTGFLIKNIKKSKCCNSSLETRIVPLKNDEEIIIQDSEKCEIDIYHD